MTWANSFHLGLGTDYLSKVILILAWFVFGISVLMMSRQGAGYVFAECGQKVWNEDGAMTVYVLNRAVVFLDVSSFETIMIRSTVTMAMFSGQRCKTHRLTRKQGLTT